MTTNHHQLLAIASAVAAIASPGVQDDLLIGMIDILVDPRSRHPDAVLIAMGRERAALVAHIDDSSQGHTDEVINRLCDDWGALDSRIMATVPQTVVGIALQLAVIWRWLDLAPGEEAGPTEKSSRDRQWLWAVKLNAERLAGDAA